MDKRLCSVIVLLVLSIPVYAQEPVSWSYTAKKVSAGEYELRFTARIEDGWHIYSQQQKGFTISKPTSFKYGNNPLVELQGNTKEEGQMIHDRNADLGTEQNEYANKVDFIQRLKLKAAVTTNIQVTVIFQTCTDHECLPPDNKTFTIALPQSASITN
jgi:hypothetical protein